jgi:hypothetical protein
MNKAVKFLLEKVLLGGLLLLVSCSTQQPMTNVADDEAIEQELASLAYSGPITITKGGTYTGNWQSLDPNVPAVTVDTEEPVTIQNCNLRSRGHLIAHGRDHVKLTVRGCRGLGLNPNIAGQSAGRFVFLVTPDYAIIERNYFKQTGGIWIINYGGNFTPKHTIKVRYNRAVNIDGRHSDGNGGYRKGIKDWDKKSFMAFNNQVAVPAMEVAWNEVINYPYQSAVEDVISGYESGGVATSPLRIHDNYIQGAYGNDPLNPAAPGEDGFYSGAAMQLGDNYSNKDLGYTLAYRNQVVGHSGAGIHISGGHDTKVFGNRVVSSGALPNGKRWAWGGGINIWDYYKAIGQTNGEYYYNNRAYNNITGVVFGVRADVAGQKQRGDTWFPDCATNADGSSQCTGNKMLPDPITYQTEQNEYTLWQQKVSEAGVKIGP